MCLIKKNPPETPDNFLCPMSDASSFLECNWNVMLFSLPVFLGRLKVGIGRTITVPTDIMSVLVAALNARHGTMKQTIIVMRERGLWAQPGARLVPPAEVWQQCRRESVELSLVPLPWTQEQVYRRGPRRQEAEDLHPAWSASTAPTAGALVALRRQSLATSLLEPGNLLLWRVWFTGTFTGRTGVGAGSGRTATVAVGLHIRHIREIPLLRDWRVRLPVLHAPTVGQALTAAPPVQTQSAAPAAARVAGEWCCQDFYACAWLLFTFVHPRLKQECFKKEICSLNVASNDCTPLFHRIEQYLFIEHIQKINNDIMLPESW